MRNFLRNLLSCLILVSLSLAACTAQPEKSSTPTRAMPTSTVQPAASATAPAPTDTLTPTALPAPETFKYKQACITVDKQLPPGFSSHGGLILYDASMKHPVLLDLSSKKESILIESQHAVSVSPDGKWMAYIKDGNELNLALKNFSTKTTLNVSLGTNQDQGLRNWANNEQIIINVDIDQSPSSTILLNPFTKSSINIPSSFPDQMLENGSGTRLAPAAIDPSTNYAVYPAMQGDTFGLELFNRSTNQQIAFFPSSLASVSVAAPQWNQDGTKFIFNSSPLVDKDESKEGTDELHLGGIDGSVQQLTRLSDQVTDYDLGNLAWSPNDRYVAFVVYDMSVNKLMFLDMVNKEILDVCIDAGQGYFQDFVWSPDGTQLVINSSDSVQKILIDLPSLQAGVLSPKAEGYVRGWVLLP